MYVDAQTGLGELGALPFDLLHELLHLLDPVSLTLLLQTSKTLFTLVSASDATWYRCFFQTPWQTVRNWDSLSAGACCNRAAFLRVAEMERGAFVAWRLQCQRGRHLAESRNLVAEFEAARFFEYPQIKMRVATKVVELEERIEFIEEALAGSEAEWREWSFICNDGKLKKPETESELKSISRSSKSGRCYVAAIRRNALIKTHLQECRLAVAQVTIDHPVNQIEALKQIALNTALSGEFWEEFAELKLDAEMHDALSVTPAKVMKVTSRIALESANDDSILVLNRMQIQNIRQHLWMQLKDARRQRVRIIWSIATAILGVLIRFSIFYIFVALILYFVVFVFGGAESLNALSKLYSMACKMLTVSKRTKELGIHELEQQLREAHTTLSALENESEKKWLRFRKHGDDSLYTPFRECEQLQMFVNAKHTFCYQPFASLKAAPLSSWGGFFEAFLTTNSDQKTISANRARVQKRMDIAMTEYRVNRSLAAKDDSWKNCVSASDLDE